MVNGLYKNIGPTTMEMSGFGVYFSSYEYAKHFFRRRNFHSHCNENNVDDMKGMGESRMGGSGSDNGTGNDRDNGQMYKKNSIINSDAGNHHSVDRRRSNNGDCSDGPNCIYKKALSLSSLPSSSLSLSDEEREALIEQEPLAIHQMMMSGGFAGYVFRTSCIAFTLTHIYVDICKDMHLMYLHSISS